jgi:hypothetical protein
MTEAKLVLKPSVIPLRGPIMMRPRPEGPVCQVPGCHADLSTLKMYYQRCKICEDHHRATVILIDGIATRFCQQCAALQPITDFSKDRRSCMAALARHNTRRQRKTKVRCGRRRASKTRALPPQHTASAADPARWLHLPERHYGTTVLQALRIALHPACMHFPVQQHHH